MAGNRNWNRPIISLQLHTGTHCRYIGVREAATLEKSGQAKRVITRKDAKFNRQIFRLHPPPPEPLRDMNEASPPSITMSDMEAFVGIGSDAAQHLARKKVEMFRKDSLRHRTMPLPAKEETPCELPTPIPPSK